MDYRKSKKTRVFDREQLIGNSNSSEALIGKNAFFDHLYKYVNKITINQSCTKTNPWQYGYFTMDDVMEGRNGWLE